MTVIRYASDIGMTSTAANKRLKIIKKTTKSGKEATVGFYVTGARARHAAAVPAVINGTNRQVFSLADDDDAVYARLLNTIQSL